ncbi:MAG: hypothetical protein AAF889_02660 [Cyanobacteria bacterium P01_D01_bin.73]
MTFAPGVIYSPKFSSVARVFGALSLRVVYRTPVSLFLAIALPQ